MDKSKIFAAVCGLALTIVVTSLWASGEQRGEIIYKQACQTCHNPNTASLMKAPAAHNVAAWELRMKAAKAQAKANPSKYKNANSYLIATIKKGKGAMPAGGLCVDQSTPDKQCTDHDYIAAIKFMSSAKQQ